MDGNSGLSVVILAAGQGTRMKSALPKVLHEVAGKPMLAHVVDAAKALSPKSITIIYGHGGAIVRSAFVQDRELRWALQEPQLGTGHAVMQAMDAINESKTTLILYGDVPLISVGTLRKLVNEAARGELSWLTAIVEQPAGLGRVIRDANGQACAIVEEKDASEAQRLVHEINTGFVACPSPWLVEWLPRLGNRNAQGEYYLTDVMALAVEKGCKITTSQPNNLWETTGVNNREQLAQVERIAQLERAEELMAGGVTLRDPNRLDIRGSLSAAQDVTIDINVLIEGTVRLARGVSIGANCMLKDCDIGEDTQVLSFTSIDGANVGRNARIGPYARIRPNTRIGNDVHIGNFVEVKASDISNESKANHLSYIGDATIGERVNVGAGTITCNYDGANKHRTIIESDVHIGSDVQLIAPVTVRQGATIGAGTTVWKDAPENELTLNPKAQETRKGWRRPTKKGAS
ncbi:MAG: bifunctional UDP-N-acetylglucosamine diphosphorylase/glucosamine-1-phosphate N-acetyltransferase GlmU [Burkholderiales bacterium]|jgi:bifunctional UDP-N-acetylglucosamine pyrophosphorylase/glucosamine-1-phosphate N-acetyltransferase